MAHSATGMVNLLLPRWTLHAAMRRCLTLSHKVNYVFTPVMGCLRDYLGSNPFGLKSLYPSRVELQMLHHLSVALLPTLMIVAAVTDCLSLRIPNWLTGLVALLFFPMALVTGMPLVEFGWHILGGVILFVAGYALFSFRVFGGGDAKLMAAAGLWFGTSQSLTFLFLTVMAGGVLAIAVLGWSTLKTLAEVEGMPTDRGVGKIVSKFKPKLPYGLAFAVGAIIAYPETWWMVSAARHAV